MRNLGRWRIRLSGHPYDLEQLEKYFPDGDVHFIRDEGSHFLIGDKFTNFRESTDVRAAAEQALEKVAAVASLLDPSFRKPTIDAVMRKRADGGQDVFVHLSGNLQMRAKLGAVIVRPGGEMESVESPRPTLAQRMLALGIQDNHLERALHLWVTPNRSWTHLYAIVEELEEYLGHKISETGLCSAAQRERLRRTANNAEAAGTDARHGSGKFHPPSNPITLTEATDFIRELLLAQLKPARQSNTPA